MRFSFIATSLDLCPKHLLDGGVRLNTIRRYGTGTSNQRDPGTPRRGLARPAYMEHHAEVKFELSSSHRISRILVQRIWSRVKFSSCLAHKG